MDKETRVRMGVKQPTSGKIQMDLATEAPDVETARKLLSDAIDELLNVIEAKGLIPVHKAS